VLTEDQVRGEKRREEKSRKRKTKRELDDRNDEKQKQISNEHIRINEMSGNLSVN
jgi:hypothetical protein